MVHHGLRINSGEIMMFGEHKVRLLRDSGISEKEIEDFIDVSFNFFEYQYKDRDSSILTVGGT